MGDNNWVVSKETLMQIIIQLSQLMKIMKNLDIDSSKIKPL